MKAWIDDFAFNATTEDILLTTVKKVCIICRKKNQKLSARMPILFSTSLLWCGYVVGKDVIQCDPRRLEPLQQGHAPTEHYKVYSGNTVISLNLNREHDDAFNDITQQLLETVKLSHHDSRKPVCIYTDASDAFWASVVTQCEHCDLRIPSSSQMREELAFLGVFSLQRSAIGLLSRKRFSTFS